jgi:hypothetical protein
MSTAALPSVPLAEEENSASLAEQTVEKTSVMRGVVGRLAEWVGKREFTQKAVEWAEQTTVNVAEYFGKRVRGLNEQLLVRIREEEKKKRDLVAQTADLLREPYAVLRGAPMDEAELQQIIKEFPAYIQDSAGIERRLAGLASDMKDVSAVDEWLGKIDGVKQRLIGRIAEKQVAVRGLLEGMRDLQKETEDRSDVIMGRRNGFMKQRKELQKLMENVHDPVKLADLQKQFGGDLATLQRLEDHESELLQRNAEILKSLQKSIAVHEKESDEYMLRLSALQNIPVEVLDEDIIVSRDADKFVEPEVSEMPDVGDTIKMEQVKLVDVSKSKGLISAWNEFVESKNMGAYTLVEPTEDESLTSQDEVLMLIMHSAPSKEGALQTVKDAAMREEYFAEQEMLYREFIVKYKDQLPKV